MSFLTSNEPARKLLRANKSRPCPVCGRIDWCGLFADGSAAVCMRVKNATPTKNGGWLHRLKDRPQRRPVGRFAGYVKVGKAVKAEQRDRTPARDFGPAAEKFHAAGADRIVGLADALGVPADALARLRVGWASGAELSDLGTKCRGIGCWTFPMVDATGRTIGLRLRSPDGGKFAATGSRSGLFIPSGLAEHPAALLIVEGPTDAAALIGLGLNAVGRADCNSGGPPLAELIGKLHPERVLVLADADEPGRRGADALARLLATRTRRPIRVAQPPDGVKDARQWCRDGATAADVLGLLDAPAMNVVNAEGVNRE